MMLVNFTKEELDRLPGYQRKEALDLYHEWLIASRKTDKRILGNVESRIYRFLNPDKATIYRVRNNEGEKRRRRAKKRFCCTCNKDMTGDLGRCEYCSDCHYVGRLYNSIRQMKIKRLVTRWKKYD